MMVKDKEYGWMYTYALALHFGAFFDAWHCIDMHFYSYPKPLMHVYK